MGSAGTEWKLLPAAVVTVPVTASGGRLAGHCHTPTSPAIAFSTSTTDRNGSPVNRVERWKLSSGAKPHAIAIIDNIPLLSITTEDGFFGSDGMLYVGTGDARIRRPPRTSTVCQQDLRLTPDGQVLRTIPFQANPLISSEFATSKDLIGLTHQLCG